jgi:urea ABC transporter permease protein UrtC
MIRATVQNREMAQALGVNTRLVDMFTFAFGAGLAGLAGYGIVLTSNPTPEMGQTFIVKSFLTVVVGGVGKLAGVIVSGLGLGFIEKLLEPIIIIEKPIHLFDATWAQVAALVAVILFMQRRPAGLFPEKGRAADQADRSAAPYLTKTSKAADLILGAVFVLLGGIVVPVCYGAGWMAPEFVNKLGYIIAFAICAIGLDLVWGYIGVLSLCQFMFFSLGGYAMGLYLINHGPKAADGIPECLSYVMSTVGARTPPWFLPFFDFFPLAVLLGVLLPALLAMLIGVTTFRSRVRGVYFAILTQAITVACWLVFQKNDLKLGGTNGLTKFTNILGFTIQSNAQAGPFAQTRFWLYVASFVTLILVIVAAKLLVASGFGRVLVAIRDDETRLRFSGYQTWAYKAAAFTLAAVSAALGGMLYVPQKGIITPHQMAAGASILVVAWVAVGGRGSLWGAAIGAIFVSLLYEWMTSWKPEYWLYILGALFILVPLLFPGGLMSIPNVLQKIRARPNGSRGLAPVQATAEMVEGGAS